MVIRGVFMKGKKLSTADRILQSALQLMKNKGFSGVTIKDIADSSNVSEMTVFRHFETKRGVLEAAIKQNSVFTNLKQIIDENIVWDLEQDLELISNTYLDSMKNNEAICLIAVQERSTMPELVGLISGKTEQLKSFISEYFKEMQKREKMGKIDAYEQASALLTMLFGFFISRALWGTKFIDIEQSNFIKNSVRTICNGIKSEKG
jgi:TetR/AcrR family transcriptional regulator, mexJK operon transcriptional repressor